MMACPAPLTMRYVLALAFLTLVAGCSLTGGEGPADDSGAPIAPVLHTIAFGADAAPAVGGTARLSAVFRFARVSDSPFVAEHRLDRYIDSLYAVHGPLWVEGRIDLHPYLEFSAPSPAARIVGGEPTFAGRVTPADTVRLSADILALRADTVMAVASLRVHVDRPEGTELARSGLLGGGAFACFVVREQEGVALGDCVTTTPEQ